MTMFGADVEALRALAGALRRANDNVDASRQRLANTIESLPWAGPDSERFVDEWRRVHGPALAAVAAATMNASASASYAAHRQEQASSRDR